LSINRQTCAKAYEEIGAFKKNLSGEPTARSWAGLLDRSFTMRDQGNRSRLSKIKGQRQLQTSRILFGKMSRIRLIYPRLLLGLLYPLVSGGCSLQQPPQEQHVGDLGYFQFRAPNEAIKGVIIGVPHGSAEPASGEYAKWISDQTGAGFIVAYGFGAKGLVVTRSLWRHTRAYACRSKSRPCEHETALNEELNEA
jgi:hypothetical protein